MVHSLVSFVKCLKLYNHHHTRNKVLSSSRCSSCYILVIKFFPSLNLYSLSLWFFLFWNKMWIESYTIVYPAFSVWLLSCSIMHLKFNSCCWIYQLFLFLLISICCMSVPHMVYLFTLWRTLGCLQLLAYPGDRLLGC